METQSIITLSGLGICCVLLLAANWPTIMSWLPTAWLVSSQRRDEGNPTELIAAYHVARDECHNDAHLGELTDQLFQELICKKVLRCEK
ncbi:hypothetical protein AB1K70_19330 [Bremerella sp. JC770]|uniref:hypothetical protein n=1 Tax=Bremerella sp. JC770 TaxID=3232137 RepID=UPI00345744E1